MIQDSAGPVVGSEQGCLGSGFQAVRFAEDVFGVVRVRLSGFVDVSMKSNSDVSVEVVELGLFLSLMDSSVLYMLRLINLWNLGL